MLFEDSSTIDDYVEGDLFREGPIRLSKNNVQVHSGVQSNILKEHMESLVDFINRKDIHFLVKMCISHYILEYIHPFYDGNGRLGRFLMSSYLKRKLDIYSALSISYSINQNKSKYENLFEEVTKKNNYGELTGFVIGLLELIENGQENIKSFLEISIEKMKNIEKIILNMNNNGDISDEEANVLFYMLKYMYLMNMRRY